MKIHFRVILSVITFALIVVIVWFARHDIKLAVDLLDTVNLWILSLLIPLQLVSYYASAEMIFSYLRAKKVTIAANAMERTRIALELNFVNHALPSGGVSGIGYMNWRLKHLGVPTSRATVAQGVRMVASLGVFIIFLFISLFFLALDGQVNRFMLLMSTIVIISVILATFFAVFIISNSQRLNNFSHTIARFVNRLARHFRRKNRCSLIKEEKLTQYLCNLHEDYLHLVRHPKDLREPLLWSVLFVFTETAIFFISFLALGHVVNPASILVAYGVAGIAGFIMITPGGAGGYEVLMVSALSSAGLQPSVAVAGVLLARVILILFTIITGYIFYQLAILRHGGKKSFKLGKEQTGS